MPDPGRVIRPQRRASQRASPPERIVAAPRQAGTESPCCSYGIGQEQVRRRQPARRFRTANCWLAWAWTVSMPVTAEPDAASAATVWLPPPVSPLTCDRVQFVPSAEDHTAAPEVPSAELN